MTTEIVTGLALLGIGVFMIFIGWPDKSGESPRYLQFRAAPMLYPPFILAFLVAGIAQLFVAFF
jgi:hypothetical protein